MPYTKRMVDTYETEGEILQFQSLLGIHDLLP